MASESVAGSIIVIQPGSSHLLVGRATDSTPTIVPHVVAYRRRDGRPPPPPPPLGADASAALAGATRAALAGLARLPAAEAGAPPPQARTDEALAEWSFWDEPAGGGPPFLCGETALRLGPGAPYDLFFPLRRGRFNRAGSAGAGASAGTPSRAYSSQEVVDSLQRLWAHAILGEPRPLPAAPRRAAREPLQIQPGSSPFPSPTHTAPAQTCSRSRPPSSPRWACSSSCATATRDARRPR